MSNEIYTKRYYRINSTYLFVNIEVDNNEHFKFVSISLSCPEIKEYKLSEYSSEQGSDKFKKLIYKAFELFMTYDVYRLKRILKDIKDSEPEYYQKGLEILQKKKEQLIKDTEKKYSL